MPANNHLEFFDIKKFGGLWTAGANSQMPADRAQVMSGCHPQPGGGLRAFLTPVDTVPGTGLELGLGDTLPISFDFTPLVNSVDASVFWLVTTNGTNRLASLATPTATTPDDAALDITGDLDLRARYGSDWTPAANVPIVSNLDAAAFRGYELRLDTAGTLTLRWGDGSAVRTATSTAAVGASNPTFVRATLDVDNGAAGRDIRFYTTPDGASWSLLGAVVTQAGVTSIAASTQSLTVRAEGSSSVTAGVYWAQVRSGIDGTIVATPDFSTLPIGTTTFADGAGRTWTLDSGSYIETGAGNTTDVDTTGLQIWRSNGGAWTRYATPAFAYDTARNLTQPRFARMLLAGAGTALLGLGSESTIALAGGVYLLDDDADSATRELTALDDTYGAQGLVVHQERVVAGSKDQVLFSAPGTTDFTAAGSGSVRPNTLGFDTTGSGDYSGSLVSVILSVPPGDLLVITQDGRVFNVQGDLADPQVRELGRMTASIPHDGGVSPNGLYIIVPNQGVVLLGLDGSTEALSEDITPAVWNSETPHAGLGQLAVTERYVFCPNNHHTPQHSNGALVFDSETGAWFTSTHPDDYTIPNPRLMVTAHSGVDGGVYVVAGRAANALGVANDCIFGFRTGSQRPRVGPSFSQAPLYNPEARASTWEWKSAPLRDPNGRHLDIRVVQVPVHCFDDGGSPNSSIAVTVGSTTITKAGLPAGRSLQTFLFKQRGRELDVTIKAKSNVATVEAPMIEGVRVGWRPGPLL